jgi:hypothetical protein
MSSYLSPNPDKDLNNLLKIPLFSTADGIIFGFELLFIGLYDPAILINYFLMDK